MKREEIEAGAWMLPVKLDEDAGKDLLQNRRREANANTGGLTARRALRNLDCFLGAGESGARSDEKTFAGFCELDGTSVSIEEPHSDVLLQPLNLRRDGGLGQVKLYGGADKTLLLSDGYESSQMFQFQAGTSGDEVPDTLWVHLDDCLVNHKC